jgi:hypothetical protein
VRLAAYCALSVCGSWPSPPVGGAHELRDRRSRTVAGRLAPALAPVALEELAVEALAPAALDGAHVACATIESASGDGYKACALRANLSALAWSPAASSRAAISIQRFASSRLDSIRKALTSTTAGVWVTSDNRAVSVSRTGFEAAWLARRTLLAERA